MSKPSKPADSAPGGEPADLESGLASLRSREARRIGEGAAIIVGGVIVPYAIAAATGWRPWALIVFGGVLGAVGLLRGIRRYLAWGTVMDRVAPRSWESVPAIGGSNDVLALGAKNVRLSFGDATVLVRVVVAGVAAGVSLPGSSGLGDTAEHLGVHRVSAHTWLLADADTGVVAVARVRQRRPDGPMPPVMWPEASPTAPPSLDDQTPEFPDDSNPGGSLDERMAFDDPQTQVALRRLQRRCLLWGCSPLLAIVPLFFVGSAAGDDGEFNGPFAPVLIGLMIASVVVVFCFLPAVTIGIVWALKVRKYRRVLAQRPWCVVERPTAGSTSKNNQFGIEWDSASFVDPGDSVPFSVIVPKTNLVWQRWDFVQGDAIRFVRISKNEVVAAPLSGPGFARGVL